MALPEIESRVLRDLHDDVIEERELGLESGDAVVELAAHLMAYIEAGYSKRALSVGAGMSDRWADYILSSLNRPDRREARSRKAKILLLIRDDLSGAAPSHGLATRGGLAIAKTRARRPAAMPEEAQAMVPALLELLRQARGAQGPVRSTPAAQASADLTAMMSKAVAVGATPTQLAGALGISTGSVRARLRSGAGDDP